MATFLFGEIIFGPVNSRRLGKSLGINLLPVSAKYCNFNCIYCECGLTRKGYGRLRKEMPAAGEIVTSLEKVLNDFRENNKIIDTITFAGNGEPTLHPEFPEIVDSTILLRNKLYPDAKIAVLSNATMISKVSVHQALSKVDYNILKLDSVNEDTVRMVNCPSGNFNLSRIIEELRNFNNLTIQSLFFRGEYKGRIVDNTTNQEIDSLLETVVTLKPEHVMIYTISRDTPVKNLSNIGIDELERIAEKFRNRGLKVSVSS